MGILFEAPVPLKHMHGIGIFITCCSWIMWFGKVEEGRLFAPRRECRFLTPKSFWMEEMEVVLGDL